MTQSAVSQAVARLEEQIGVQVLDRSNREVVLTRAGEEMLPAASRLLEDAERMIQHGGEWAGLRRGTLRLLSISSIAHRLLPHIVRQFSERYPGIAIEVDDDKDQPLRQRIKAGEGDLALLTCDSTEQNFRTLPLLRDRFVVLCPTGHSLARRRTVREQDLRGVTMIMLKRGTILRSYIDGVVTRLPLDQPRIEVDQMQTLIGMLEGGLGVALVSGLACPSPALTSVTTRPFSSAVEVSRLVGFARPFASAAPPAAAAFARLTLEYLKSGQTVLPQGVSRLPVRASDLSAFLA